MNIADLSKPFPPQVVSWRVGATTQDKTKGMALAYIDARDVMQRLDEVCGPAGWQNRYPHANGKTVCDIGIKIGDEWIWKSNGAGDTDNEAEKGALSDAFKRAAVQWGIGRYLYDVDSPWVAIEPHGKSYRIPNKELQSLRALLNKFAPVGQLEGHPNSTRVDAGSSPAGSANPKVEKAREDFKRIKGALIGAKTVKTVDSIMVLHKDDLDALQEVHAKSFDDLVALAETRRVDLMGATV